VGWTSVGAICKIAPGLSATDPTVWADHVSVAWEAFELLEEAARQQGHAHSVDVDRSGRESALMMFWRAPAVGEASTPRRRRGPATPRRRRGPGAGSGHGSSPKGAAA